MDVTDRLGLVLENQLLTLYIPASQRAFVFRVVSRQNRGCERIPYGPLPLPNGLYLPTYDGTVATVPADGVIPSRAFTPEGISFPIGVGTPLPLETTAYSASDMWHLPSKEYKERVFHIRMEVVPQTLRCDLQIPARVIQNRFQRDKVSIGIEYDWGFQRGGLETVQLPGVHYGWRFGNDLNISFYTYIRFTYGEYVVEIPRDPELIFSVLNRKTPSHWVTLGVVGSYDESFRRALNLNYGFEGFPLYGLHQKTEALREYGDLLGRMM